MNIMWTRPIVTSGPVKGSAHTLMDNILADFDRGLSVVTIELEISESGMSSHKTRQSSMIVLFHKYKLKY